jgi:NOPS (NUC059) domain
VYYNLLMLCREREQPPRFAQPGSFEYEFGLKWKTLYQLLHEQQEALKKNFEEEVVKMEMDMEAALLEQHTVMLRQGKIISPLHFHLQFIDSYQHMIWLVWRKMDHSFYKIMMDHLALCYQV